MIFDMRNWHLVGGVQFTGELPKVDADNNTDKYVDTETSDPTCAVCGFVECECNPCEAGLFSEYTPDYFKIEYEAAFPKIANVKLSEHVRRGIPVMQDGRRIGIAMSDSDENGIVTVALDNMAV